MSRNFVVFFFCGKLDMKGRGLSWNFLFRMTDKGCPSFDIPCFWRVFGVWILRFKKKPLSEAQRGGLLIAIGCYPM